MEFAQMDARLRRLEGRKRWCAPVVSPHPEPSDAWIEEVLQLLLVYGQFVSVDAVLEALRESAGEVL